MQSFETETAKTSAWRKGYFHFASAVSLLASLYHVVALAAPDLVVSVVPAWRHALFIAISLLCAYLFQRRPLWFLYALAALTLQQFDSHGHRFLRMWEEGRFDWMSVVVLTLLPLTLALMVHERRALKKYAGAA